MRLMRFSVDLVTSSRCPTERLEASSLRFLGTAALLSSKSFWHTTRSSFSCCSCTAIPSSALAALATSRAVPGVFAFSENLSYFLKVSLVGLVSEFRFSGSCFGDIGWVLAFDGESFRLSFDPAGFGERDCRGEGLLFEDCPALGYRAFMLCRK